MIALVLLAAGVLTVVAGIVLMVVGGRGETAPVTTGYVDWADAGPSRTRPGLVVGALLSVVGVVLAASGAVVLVTQSGGDPDEVTAAGDPGESNSEASWTSAPSETSPPVTTTSSETSEATDARGTDSPDNDGGSDNDRGSDGGTRGSGDLGLSTPITRPSCDGRGIVILYSAVTPEAYESEISIALANNPGAKYLRTDQSCPSLRQRDDNGNVIYAVYRESGYTKAELCADVAVSPGGAYGRWLDTTSDPSELVTC